MLLFVALWKPYKDRLLIVDRSLKVCVRNIQSSDIIRIEIFFADYCCQAKSYNVLGNSGRFSRDVCSIVVMSSANKPGFKDT